MYLLSLRLPPSPWVGTRSSATEIGGFFYALNVHDQRDRDNTGFDGLPYVNGGLFAIYRSSRPLNSDTMERSTDVLVIDEMAQVCGASGRITVEANMGAISTVMHYGTERQKQGERTLAAATPERRALLQSFVTVSRNAETVSSTMLNLMLSVQSGVARAMGRTDVPPLQVLRERMEPQRQQMEQQVAPLVLAMAADMYAPVSDADLRAYVDFQSSPPGRHFTDTALRALDAAVAQSAEELGRLVAPR